jgi:GWxTD domain-containing protein
MKKKLLIFFFLFFQFFLLQLLPSKKSVKELPAHHRKWLEEEVVYIITDKEKDIFLQLGSDRDRNLFMEAFWKIRDPVLGTVENEFKKEHYRRIAYADKFFGRETTRQGWRTDRGRIYIILGPPVSIDRFPDRMALNPAEIWFYHGDPDHGFPTAFNLVFYRKSGIGEHRLYSPVQNGPLDLLRDTMVHEKDGRSRHLSPSDYEGIYEQLFKLAPVLALNSLTLIPGEQVVPGHLSLASEILISNIYTYPQKRVDDEYAEKLLRYKDIVEVEYTANYIYSDVLVKSFQDPSGIFFVHYAIEPSELSIDAFENKYIANFKIIGKVSDLEEKTIFQYEKNIPLSFEEDQLQEIKTQSYSIQDMIPLIPGHYKFDVILKNTISKEFTSFEKDITIPPDISSLQMTPLFLGYKAERSSTPLGVKKPFYIENHQILSQPTNVFLPRENLAVFFQIFGLSDYLREEGTLKFIFDKNGEAFFEKEKKINEYQGKRNFLEVFPLENFKPASYEVKVFLLGRDNKEILFEKEYFDITPLAGLPRPWIFAKVMPTLKNIEYYFILGNQLLSKGDLDKAKNYLERAYQSKPASLKYAMSVSDVYFRLKEYRKVKELLTPFLGSQKENFEFLKLLGKSCQSLKEFNEAISYYKQYLDHMGTNLEILNSIGTCYYLLGDMAQALVAWEKSLEINPNQEKLKETVKSIKDKKNEK